MILKILLLIIFFQLFLETFREGMIFSNTNVTATEPPSSTINNSFLEIPNLNTDCSFNENIKFPHYNQTDNLYTNKNNFLSNNYQNILNAIKSTC